MVKTSWNQGLEVAMRAIELLTRAAHATSHGPSRARSARLASHRNVKVIGNYRHLHAN